jgi:hypothetical protein
MSMQHERTRDDANQYRRRLLLTATFVTLFVVTIVVLTISLFT